MDEHRQLQKMHKAYAPKIAEFCCYCEIFYRQDEKLTHQVTESKLKSFLFYCFYCKLKPRGRKKQKHGAVQFDDEQANTKLSKFTSLQRYESLLEIAVIFMVTDLNIFVVATCRCSKTDQFLPKHSWD